VTLVHDGSTDVADVIANRLGLQRVGWITTRPFVGECDLNAASVMDAAEIQNKYGGYCTTLIMSRDESGFPTTTAWQVSKQAMALQRDGMG